MSNPFKAIGKVFKTVVNVVKKIALPALMIGAVVLTGGAALGVLPAIGSVLGSIGISGTLASVLGGAISMGAVGAVTGGLTGALTGGGFWKGAETGFLGGAATGGLLGGVGVIGANGIFGSLGQGAAAAGGDAATSSVGGLTINNTATAAALNNTFGSITSGMSSGLGLSGGLGSAAAGAATSAGGIGVGGATAAAAAGHGLLGLGDMGTAELLKLGGGLLSGFASGSQQQAQLQAEQQMLKDKYDRIAFNYGYTNNYANGGYVPTSTTPWYQYQNLGPPQQPTGAPDSSQGGLLAAAYGGAAPTQMGLAPTTYDIINGQVVARGG